MFSDALAIASESTLLPEASRLISRAFKYRHPVVEQSSEHAAETGHGKAEKNRPGDRNLDLHQVGQPAAFRRLQAEVQAKNASDDQRAPE